MPGASAICVKVPADTGWVLLLHRSGAAILPGHWGSADLALRDGRQLAALYVKEGGKGRIGGWCVVYVPALNGQGKGSMPTRLFPLMNGLRLHQLASLVPLLGDQVETVVL